MAHHIKADGQVILIEPKNGRTFQLDELQEFVGGYIEIVYGLVRDVTIVDSNGNQIIPKNSIMVVNEEGRLKGLPPNELASFLGQQLIVGNVLVCKRRQVR